VPKTGEAKRGVVLAGGFKVDGNDATGKGVGLALLLGFAHEGEQWSKEKGVFGQHGLLEPMQTSGSGVQCKLQDD